MNFPRSFAAIVANNVIRTQQHLYNPPCQLLRIAVIKGSDRCTGLTTSTRTFEKPSSKIEETVQHLKEGEKPEKLQDEAVKTSTVKVPEAKVPTVKPSEPHGAVQPLKKSLWQRFIDECKHYYSGFKLLFLDVRVSSKIVWKILNGHQLTRRESKQLVRTTSDLFRLVPFSVFIIVPFMELLLPVALKLFPGMLPSTFTTTSEREAKMKRALAAKLEYAKFLQKTLDEMAPVDSKDRSSKSARDFVNFYKKIKTQGTGTINIEDILKFSKLFEDSITLDNMTRSQLAAICRLLELTPIGTTNFLRLQIEMRLRHLIADDKVIRKEGLENLTIQELQQACKERGMRAIGISADTLRKQLQQWLDLSQNAKVPPSLLLLSRTLYLPETLDPEAQIAATISALPESAASATSAQIGEREGKIRNVVRLEQIREEQRKIELEEAERLKVKKAAETKLKLPTVKDVQEVMQQAAIEKEFFDKAPVLIDKALNLSEKEKQMLNASDFGDLKTAIEHLAKLRSESKELETLKKELVDYVDDLKDLDSIKETLNKFNLTETKGARRLFGKVNAMLSKMDEVVEGLKQKEKEIEEKKSTEGRSEEEVIRDDENLVTVQELIDAVGNFQRTPDSAKLERIAEVLSAIDVDADGMIKIDHVVKVLELLGNEQDQLTPKQIRHIVDMLTKEEMLEVEKNIEILLDKQDEELKTESRNE